MKNPFKKQEPVQISPEDHENRSFAYGGLIVQDPYAAAGLYGSAIYGNHQAQIKAAAQAASQGPLSASQTAQIQNYQQQINQQMQAIQQAQQSLGQQHIFIGKSINVEGVNLRVTEEDYNYIILEGYKALKKREEYKDDFDKLLK